MNVLSLFDGMSCGQIALDKLGIKVDNYYAAEIDKYAIKVAKANYPNTIHLGDVRDVMWPETFEGVKIDLLIGGSPCQGFSFAGKQLNFDDPRSKLFWEYVRLLKECKPKYFLLENVKMKKESMDVITEALGVEPIFINSSLVSAQNRQRYYWTNIPVDGLPDDKGIRLRDILEDGAVDRDKAHCIDANYFKGGNLKSYFEKRRRQLVFEFDENKPLVVGEAEGNQYLQERKVYDPKGKSPTLTGQRASNVPKIPATASGLIQVGETEEYQHYNNDQIKRVYHPDGKAPTLLINQGGNREPKVFVEPTNWRKLTPLECERLQTVPDGYTAHVSNTQRYKMLGNGWTVDVIKHIFEGIEQ